MKPYWLYSFLLAGERGAVNKAEGGSLASLFKPQFFFSFSLNLTGHFSLTRYTLPPPLFWESGWCFCVDKLREGGQEGLPIFTFSRKKGEMTI